MLFGLDISHKQRVLSAVQFPQEGHGPWAHPEDGSAVRLTPSALSLLCPNGLETQARPRVPA